MTHVHHWKLPAPNGTEAVMASCKLCGEKKPHWTGWRDRGAGTPWHLPRLVESSRKGQKAMRELADREYKPTTAAKRIALERKALGMRVKTHAKGGRARI